MAYLQAVIAALPPILCIFACSPVYETEPWGYIDQPAFLNQVVAGRTTLLPGTLLTRIKKLEAKLGRTPTFRNGPREIDIDILFYDDLILESLKLILPHPRLHERAFVLVPLADIAPELQHPQLRKTVLELLAEIDRSGVKIYQQKGNQHE